MADGLIEITPELSIPESELTFRASRAGGPGGQHVNTSSTRVELVWDALGSRALTDQQRELILSKLDTRISTEGLLILACSTTRSQHRNREEVTQRFAEILRDALHVPKARRKTKVPKGAKEERLKEKKERSEKKKMRGPIAFD
jgi:ribosome-associated protein